MKGGTATDVDRSVCLTRKALDAIDFEVVDAKVARLSDGRTGFVLVAAPRLFTLTPRGVRATEGRRPRATGPGKPGSKRKK